MPTDISRLKSILRALVVCTSFLGLSACGWKSYIPTELKSSWSMKKIYEVDGTHWVGPRGINEAFIVYSIPDKALQRLQNEGLAYLTNLDSTKQYEDLFERYEKLTEQQQRESHLDFLVDTEGLYKGWRATPIQIEAEQRWIRDRRKNGKHDTKCIDVSLCSFYGDYKSIPQSFKKRKTLKKRSLNDLNFVDDIKPEYVELVVNILNSPNSYLGYGESGAIILSPEHKTLFLLYRD